MKKGKEILSNEKGSALVMVLVLTIVFSIMGISLIQLQSSHHYNLLQNELKSQSYYAAEAGVSYRIQEWKNGNTTLSPLNRDIGVVDGVSLEYQVELIQNPDLTYTLTSIGTAKKSDTIKQSTTLTVTLSRRSIPSELAGIEMFDYTIFSGTQGGRGPGSHDMFLGEEISGGGNRGVALRNDIDIYGALYASRFYLYTADPRLEFHNAKLVTDKKDDKSIYKLDEDKKSNKKENLLSEAELRSLYDNSVTVVEVDGKLKFSDQFGEVFDALTKSSKMHTINEDIHITKGNVDEKENWIRNELGGWVYLPTHDFVVDEGVEINLDELVVVADGILIGAKTNNSIVDESVKIKGNHIILVADSNLDAKWKDESPINYSSYRNEYLGNGQPKWENLSILSSRKVEIDGWLVGLEDVVFDYKVGEENDLNPYTAKIKGGVSGLNGMFPRKIELGSDDLYFEDWNTE